MSSRDDKRAGNTSRKNAENSERRAQGHVSRHLATAICSPQNRFLWSKPPRSLRGNQGGSLKVGEWRMDRDPGGGSAAARGLAREPADLGRRRVVQQPALDPGAVVCVTVRRDHGHAHQRARDRARELVAELLSREQRHGGHGAVLRRRARVLRHAPPAPLRHPLENGAVNWPQRRETRPPRGGGPPCLAKNEESDTARR